LRASGDGRLGAILYGVGGQLSVLLLRPLVFVDYVGGLEDFGPWWRHRRDGFIREDSLHKNDVAEAEERNRNPLVNAVLLMDSRSKGGKMGSSRSGWKGRKRRVSEWRGGCTRVTLELLGPDGPPPVLVGCQARWLGIAGVAGQGRLIGAEVFRLQLQAWLVQVNRIRYVCTDPYKEVAQGDDKKVACVTSGG
jgi:hypothetical protein